MKTLWTLFAASVLVFASEAGAGSTEPSSHGGGEAEKSTSLAAAEEEASGGGEESASGEVHWTYSGRSGPSAWGDLAVQFRSCKAGRMQSPIDLRSGGGLAAAGEAIEFDYRMTPLRIVHNGHTIQVNYDPGSAMFVGGKRYELLQLHFHTPSEHVVDGWPASMEMHLVHLGPDGELAVVGVLLETGPANLALGEIWANMPKKKGKERVFGQVAINARDLLPGDRSYYRYMGSLTTPPCSEGVNWYVLKQPLQVDGQQIAEFAQAIGNNARPAQAMNSRLLIAPLDVN